MCTGTKTFSTPIKIDLPIARTLLKTMGNRHRAGVDNYYTVDGRIRMLSEREALRLMGFTDDFKQVISRAQMYKQAGNSIVVDVMIAIVREISQYSIRDLLKKNFPDRHVHELRYTFITRAKECGVNPEVVMIWAGHESDSDVKTSRVDRGYTTYSEEYYLSEIEKINYSFPTKTKKH